MTTNGPTHVFLASHRVFNTCHLRPQVDRKDNHGYTAFVAAVEWGRSCEVLQSLLAHGASVNAETLHPGFTALAAAAAGNTPVDPTVVAFLLAAKADTSVTFTLPTIPNLAKQTARAWAVAQNRKAVVAAFEVFFETSNDLDEDLSSRALASGAIDAESLNELRTRIASGATSNQEAAAALKAQVETHERKLLQRDIRERAKAVISLIRASLQGSSQEALAEQVASAAADRPHPKGEKPLLGGRCLLQGLKGAAQLNGQAGHIVNWNVDGRRRYGVCLDGSGKLVSCPMRSVVPLDKPWLAYPHDFECSSTEFVATLQSELRAQGSSLIVLDWTPLAAAVSDVVYLLHVAHEISLIDFVRTSIQAIANDDDAEGDLQSHARAVLSDCRAAQDVLIFVLSDAQTAPFFLAHREFIAPGATLHSNAEIAALPWLAIGKSLTIVPQAWEQTCKKEYMLRLSLNLVQSEFTCVICHEVCLYLENPTQLPCAHFMCTSCLKQLCPPISALERINAKATPKGITCPVCRTHFPGHSLAEHASAPGGVAIFEHAVKR